MEPGSSASLPPALCPRRRTWGRWLSSSPGLVPSHPALGPTSSHAQCPSRRWPRPPFLFTLSHSPGTFPSTTDARSPTLAKESATLTSHQLDGHISEESCLHLLPPTHSSPTAIWLPIPPLHWGSSGKSAQPSCCQIKWHLLSNPYAIGFSGAFESVGRSFPLEAISSLDPGFPPLPFSEHPLSLFFVAPSSSAAYGVPQGPILTLVSLLPFPVKFTCSLDSSRWPSRKTAWGRDQEPGLQISSMHCLALGQLLKTPVPQFPQL